MDWLTWHWIYIVIVQQCPNEKFHPKWEQLVLNVIDKHWEPVWEPGHPVRTAQHWNTGIDTNEKKKEEKKSQAKYRKEEKGKTYIKKHNKTVEIKHKQERKNKTIKEIFLKTFNLTYCP